MVIAQQLNQLASSDLIADFDNGSLRPQSKLKSIMSLPFKCLARLVERLHGQLHGRDVRQPHQHESSRLTHIDSIDHSASQPLWATNPLFESSFDEQQSCYPARHPVAPPTQPAPEPVNEIQPVHKDDLDPTQSTTLNHTEAEANSPARSGYIKPPILDWRGSYFERLFSMTPYGLTLGRHTANPKIKDLSGVPNSRCNSQDELNKALKYIFGTPQSMVLRGQTYAHLLEDKVSLFDETGVAQLRFHLAQGAVQNNRTDYFDIDSDSFTLAAVHEKKYTPLGCILQSKMYQAVCDADQCVSFENMAFGVKSLLIPIQQLFGGPHLHNMNVKGIRHPIAQLITAQLPLKFARVVIPAMLRYGLTLDKGLKQATHAEQIQQHYQLANDDTLVDLLKNVAKKTEPQVQQWQQFNRALVQLAQKPHWRPSKQQKAVEQTLAAVFDALEGVQRQGFLFIPEYLPLRNLFDALALLPRLNPSSEQVALAQQDGEQFIAQHVPHKNAFGLQQRCLAAFGLEPSLTNILYFFSGIARDALMPLQPSRLADTQLPTMYQRRDALSHMMSDSVFTNQYMMTYSFDLNAEQRAEFKTKLQTEINELSSINQPVVEQHRTLVVYQQPVKSAYFSTLLGRHGNESLEIRALLAHVPDTKIPKECHYLPYTPAELQWHLAEPYRITGAHPPEQIFAFKK